MIREDKLEKAIEIIKHISNLGYGIVIEGDTKKNNEALDIAIDTMRKYQKIEDIYYHQRGEALENSLRAVIEDGKS